VFNDRYRQHIAHSDGFEDIAPDRIPLIDSGMLPVLARSSSRKIIGNLIHSIVMMHIRKLIISPEPYHSARCPPPPFHDRGLQSTQDIRILDCTFGENPSDGRNKLFKKKKKTADYPRRTVRHPGSWQSRDTFTGPSRGSDFIPMEISVTTFHCWHFRWWVHASGCTPYNNPLFATGQHFTFQKKLFLA
jgi:hypothetical protein